VLGDAGAAGSDVTKMPAPEDGGNSTRFAHGSQWDEDGSRIAQSASNL
jgi:hypothetical protein